MVESNPAYYSPDARLLSVGSYSNNEDDMQPADAQESSKDYLPGGYCPVQLGEVFNERYRVIRKVGWGHFSTVWFCWDSDGQRFVALKIVKASESFTIAAADEIKILESCMKTDPTHPGKRRIIELIDSFQFKSVNGEHTCMIFEALGSNLLQLIIDNDYKGLPLNQVRIIIKQILQGLSYMHDSCSTIHTDIKLENILVEMTPDELRNMAKKVMTRITEGTEADPTEVCNLPKKMSIPKNKRKKLRKKRKTLHKLLMKQLGENAPTDDDASTNVNLSTVHDDAIVQKKKIVKKKKKKNKKRKQDISMITAGLNNMTINSEEGVNPDDGKFTGTFCDVLANLSALNDDQTDDMQVKIADFGNACWRDHHFSSDIQTRQYRALEVIIGAGYDTSADIWSVGCLAFELATGDFLFEPKGNTEYGHDDDHLALIGETLGPIPPKIFKRGEYWKEFFNPDGTSTRIRKLTPWALRDVLMDKYKFSERDAHAFNDFLLGLLRYDPNERLTAAEALQHKWINSPILENADDTVEAKKFQLKRPASI